MNVEQENVTETVLAEGLRQSRWLRGRPGDARWMIAEGVGYLANATHDGREAERLREHLGGRIRDRYGNPILVWFLLNFVLPIVVRLVIEWWNNRKGT